MRLLRPAWLLLLACAACSEPTAPAPAPFRPWYSGEWKLVDSIVVAYAYADYQGSGATVSFDVTDWRLGTLQLSPVGHDSMEVVTRGVAGRLIRSSASADVEGNQPLDFTDTLYTPPGYIVGMYMSGPDDSLPLPAEATDSIYWIADTLAVCRSWRRVLTDPASNLVPGSFACRHRIRWQRP